MDSIMGNPDVFFGGCACGSHLPPPIPICSLQSLYIARLGGQVYEDKSTVTVALSVSSHVCRDRRAGGSFQFAGAKEVGQIGWSMISDNHLSELTTGAFVEVLNLGKGCG
jgi:hypothetical protein